MPTYSASDARANLYRLIDDVAESHRPARITGRRSNAILIAEDDWNAIQETLYLLTIPGLRQAALDDLTRPAEQCSEAPGW